MCDLNRSQREIQKAARDFARGEFDKDLALEMEKEGAFPGTIRRKAGALGFLGLNFPERYGGAGLGLFEAALVTEVLCRQDSSIGSALVFSTLGAECLLRFGSEALQQRFLPDLAEGKACSALAVSEPGLGGQWSAVQTTAVADGENYILNGCKTHVLNGGQAVFYIVLCRTTDDTAGMLLVEAERPGIAICALGRKLGTNMTPAADLRLSGVRVPADHLVGREDRGAAQLERVLEEIYVLTAAQALGIAAGAFDRALAYVKQREAFGRTLTAFEITRHKIAAMAARIEGARAVVYQAARSVDAGRGGLLPATAKWQSSQAAVQTADDAIQLFGGYGYMRETEVERFFRDAKTLDLLFGGRTALKQKMADSVIGKLRR
jgi:alkylation response protein AidB-like acyl-CoA dehydrogenase